VLARLHSLNFAAPERPNVQTDDLMSEGGRKVMAFHFGRLLTKQAEVLASDESEAVHQMRVATRRLRSTLRIFRPYYRQSVLRPFRRALRAVAEALGKVRDLDVYRQHLSAYTKQQPAASRRELRLLNAGLAVPHSALRQSLCDYLLSEAHTEFLSAFAAFVQTPLAGVREGAVELPVPQRVCEVVPRLIYEQYGVVRAYAPLLSTATAEQLHALRIEVKRLRYLIEAFGELLGTRAELPVEACKQLQDFLGDLQDSEVAGQLTAHYFPNVQRGKRALQRYLSARHAQGATLRAGVDEQWAAFNAPAVREALALAIAAL
jgi:CHAD domain-containing protein